ncbi:DUF362 domain-containing protein [Anaeromassilibacillus sp. SJQ-1]|uniref:DUF362 domain-containing protein n=1 Tax=Anaeromassilibacillus sp. SJQ-1 TaxID=3375419 RepID=UPI00398903C8
MKKQVYLSACAEYDFETVRHVLREQLDALHVQEFLFPGCRVVLKPNLVLRSKPEEGMITHPVVVAAVAVELFERGAGQVCGCRKPRWPLILRLCCVRFMRRADTQKWPRCMDLP